MGSEPPVYQPAEDTWLLIDCISGLTFGGVVVEVGSGSGVVSRHIAERGVEVVAIEISEAAARSTLENCSHLPSLVHVIVGDKLSPLRPSSRISLIASNPPYLPSENTSDITTEGGQTGAEFAISLIDGSEEFLEAGAKLVLITSTLGNVEAITRHATAKGLSLRHIASKRLFFEEIRCYELWKDGLESKL
ncbi:Release factor glutamine methyltransferase [Candidatus Calditenuaceae archaeon HR02]|nr:Release factor glutamine methyltransferase [Candidatus Calditenuaceae archaeon HR02]